jgi:steroid 5-alpha reductase family enzyme
MVQGIWVMFVSMPMLFVNSSNMRKQGLSVYDIACRIFFGSGLLIEVVADFQKAKWVKSGRQGFFAMLDFVSTHVGFEILSY